MVKALKTIYSNLPVEYFRTPGTRLYYGTLELSIRHLDPNPFLFMSQASEVLPNPEWYPAYSMPQVRIN